MNLGNIRRFTARLTLCLLCTSAIVLQCLTPGIAARMETAIGEVQKTVYLCSRDVGTSSAEHHYEFYIKSSDINENSLCTDNPEIFTHRSIFFADWYLCADPCYPGTAHMLFEDKSKRAYTIILNVLPYENPIKSLRITNVNNGKNLAKKLNKSTTYQKNMIFQKKTAVPKVVVEAAKDWEIQSMNIYVYPADATQEYSPKRVKSFSGIQASFKEVKLKEVAKGGWIHLHIYLKNKKTVGIRRSDFRIKWLR